MFYVESINLSLMLYCHKSYNYIILFKYNQLCYIINVTHSSSEIIILRTTLRVNVETFITIEMLIKHNFDHNHKKSLFIIIIKKDGQCKAGRG